MPARPCTWHPTRFEKAIKVAAHILKPPKKTWTSKTAGFRQGSDLSVPLSEVARAGAGHAGILYRRGRTRQATHYFHPRNHPTATVLPS